MDGTRMFLEFLVANNLAEGRLRGVFHIAIGRRLTAPDGTVASGMTWRDLSALLKAVKFEKEWIRSLGADPETLAPRDREKFWYHAIAIAKVDSAEARAEADRLAGMVRPMGWIVGPPPTVAPAKPSPTTPATADPADVETPLPKGKKKPKKK